MKQRRIECQRRTGKQNPQVPTSHNPKMWMVKRGIGVNIVVFGIFLMVHLGTKTPPPCLKGSQHTQPAASITENTTLMYCGPWMFDERLLGQILCWIVAFFLLNLLPFLLAGMHVVTTPLFLIRLLWVHKPHRHARCPKLSCWRPPLSFTHERLMCLTSIMMTTYSIAMALCCSPMLFPLFLAQACYHRLLIGLTKPPRLRSHSRFRVPSPPPLVPTNHLATPPEFHFAPLFPWETIECNMASTGTQRSSFSSTVPSPSFPVTIGTGATFTITPFCSDFITGLTSTEGAKLHGLATGLRIEGSGTVHWNLPADDGSQITLTMTAYYVPEAKWRLLSPQHYLQNSSDPTKQHFAITATHMEFVLEHRQKATIKYHHQNNLPTIQMWNAHQQREPQAEAMEACVLNVNNMNLTPPQKELLHWHFRLSNQGFDSLQRLLQTGYLGNSPLTRAAAKCDIPTCSTCEFAKAKRRPTATKQQLPVPSKTQSQMGSTLSWAMGFDRPFHGH